MQISQWSLYKEHPKRPTDIPDRAELYLIQLFHDVTGEGVRIYKVREQHGWWDDAESKAVLIGTTLDPVEPFVKEEDARDWVNKQIAHRGKNGFRWVVTLDPQSEEGYCIGFLHPNLSKPKEE